AAGQRGGQAGHATRADALADRTGGVAGAAAFQCAVDDDVHGGQGGTGGDELVTGAGVDPAGVGGEVFEGGGGELGQGGTGQGGQAPGGVGGVVALGEAFPGPADALAEPADQSVQGAKGVGWGT